MGYICELPENALTDKDILDKIDTYLELGHFKWREGRASGAVYNYDQHIIDLITQVYGKTSYTNPLHSDLFPGICKMEAECVRMVATLFNGGPETCGTVSLALEFGRGLFNLLFFHLCFCVDDNRWN